MCLRAEGPSKLRSCPDQLAELGQDRYVPRIARPETALKVPVLALASPAMLLKPLCIAQWRCCVPRSEILGQRREFSKTVQRVRTSAAAYLLVTCLPASSWRGDERQADVEPHECQSSTLSKTRRESAKEKGEDRKEEREGNEILDSFRTEVEQASSDLRNTLLSTPTTDKRNVIQGHQLLLNQQSGLRVQVLRYPPQHSHPRGSTTVLGEWEYRTIHSSPVWA